MSSVSMKFLLGPSLISRLALCFLWFSLEAKQNFRMECASVESERKFNSINCDARASKTLCLKNIYRNVGKLNGKVP